MEEQPKKLQQRGSDDKWLIGCDSLLILIAIIGVCLILFVLVVPNEILQQFVQQQLAFAGVQIGPQTQPPSQESLVAKGSTNISEPGGIINVAMMTNTPTSRSIATDPATPTITPTPIPTNTAAPINTPTPIPTNTAAPTSDLLSDLKDELYFTSGGGDGPGCYKSSPPPGVNLPMIDIEIRGRFSFSCLWGFPSDEEVTLDLYMPGGNYIGSGSVFGKHLHMWFPAALPAGEWYIVASSVSAYAENVFYFEPHKDPELIPVPSTGLNPLYEPIQRSSCKHPYSLGEQVEIIGVNLPPGRDIPLGIYEAGEGKFIFSKLVTTNSQGSFRTFIPTEGLVPAKYFIVAVINPNSETVNPAPFDYAYSDAGPGTCFQVEM